MPAKSYLGDSRQIEPKNLTDDEFTKYKEEFKRRLENSYETVDKKEKILLMKMLISRRQAERHFNTKETTIKK
jgi:hypothetical protein